VHGRPGLGQAGEGGELLGEAAQVLGLATRPGALLALLFLVIAVLTAHLYWQYPAAQQQLQWVFLSKDIAITGGVLLLFATGAGRYSLDARLMGK